MAALNLPTSPAARAFFKALDDSSKSSSPNCVNTSSSLIRKKIQVLGWRNRYSQEPDYPVTVRDATFHVRQVQRGELEGTYGTGATVWPASMVLIKFLERQPSVVEGRHVVDLGSGTAVTTVAAAVLKARAVVCTDGEAPVVQLALDNIRSASRSLRSSGSLAGSSHDSAEENISTSNTFDVLGCPVTVQEYWWGSDTVLPGPPADLVLVSDCVLPKLYPIAPLVTALDVLLTQPSAVAILSYEKRWYPDYDPKEKFVELANSKQLEVEVIPVSEQDDVYSVEDIELWRVKRRQ
jgi:predicted nicotinamide N-methyase